ncbi:PLDc_N domain-containing protein [Skermania sp. ID1734]|nr:PLD nuclease N-terminal domain-containing protein [Skermania sp. ID1734]TSE00346.1 PLDc_N domain-containing protein [Skermania sp. ID1734]
MPYALLMLVTVVLWVYCLVDALMAPDAAIRNLPKIGWVLVIILMPLLGSLLWLFAGRPIGPSRLASNTRFSEYDRPGRQVAQNPEDDEAFLQALRERAAAQRREAQRQEEARQREAERRRNAGD